MKLKENSEKAVTGKWKAAGTQTVYYDNAHTVDSLNQQSTSAQPNKQTNKQASTAAMLPYVYVAVLCYVM